MSTDKAERLLAEAAGYGAQLVVFPEAFVGGYPRGSNFGVTIGSRTAKGKEEFRKYHASAIDVPGIYFFPFFFFFTSLIRHMGFLDSFCGVLGVNWF